MPENLREAKHDTEATPRKYTPMNSTTTGVKCARAVELQRSCEYRAAEGKASREEPAPMPNSAIT